MTALTLTAEQEADLRQRSLPNPHPDDADGVWVAVIFTVDEMAHIWAELDAARAEFDRLNAARLARKKRKARRPPDLPAVSYRVVVVCWKARTIEIDGRIIGPIEADCLTFPILSSETVVLPARPR